MKIEKIIKEFMEKGEITDFELRGDKRIFVRIKPEKLKSVIEKLVSSGFRHLITITGVDVGNEIELLYHLSMGGRIVSVRTLVPKDKPIIATITDIIPGAILYEREVHDLIGVIFEGCNNLSRLVLSEDWPDNIYPLRRH